MLHVKHCSISNISFVDNGLAGGRAMGSGACGGVRRARRDGGDEPGFRLAGLGWRGCDRLGSRGMHRPAAVRPTIGRGVSPGSPKPAAARAIGGGFAPTSAVFPARIGTQKHCFAKGAISS